MSGYPGIVSSVRGGMTLGALLPGDDPATQVSHLQAELNRFGASAPVGLQFVNPPVGVTGVLDNRSAALAVSILQWRLQQSLASFPGEAATVLAKLKDVTSAAAVTTPVAWVLNDLPSVILAIQKFGDAKRLPAAAPISITEVFSGFGPSTVLVGGIAALAYYLWRRRAAAKAGT